MLSPTDKMGPEPVKLPPAGGEPYGPTVLKCSGGASDGLVFWLNSTKAPPM
eukprot:CAMPEP_0198500250 /NCGR_PEP_ID=MMETSP1462-20131121/8068_1 /TAXON_ID=1333877 /ORGANISM="Brandtodinium nutriculum, Strain RCC3387" /LENGTH=50 /DNA_ID=CAMNT_0044229255 /DNA_START=130 /DNA_END=279 /DNA_ORIENTATION=-